MAGSDLGRSSVQIEGAWSLGAERRPPLECERWVWTRAMAKERLEGTVHEDPGGLGIDWLWAVGKWGCQGQMSVLLMCRADWEVSTGSRGRTALEGTADIQVQTAGH